MLGGGGGGGVCVCVWKNESADIEKFSNLVEEINGIVVRLLIMGVTTTCSKESTHLTWQQARSQA